VAHNCNPSYLGGRDQEVSWFKTSPGEKVSETLISINESGIVVHVCNLSYMGAVDRRILVTLPEK
jgi:hypothetical protein